MFCPRVASLCNSPSINRLYTYITKRFFSWCDSDFVSSITRKKERKNEKKNTVKKSQKILAINLKGESALNANFNVSDSGNFRQYATSTENHQMKIDEIN